MTISATPIATRSMVLDTKYGKNIRTRPQMSGTTAFCFRPYMKKPRPIEPNSNPHRSQDSFNVFPGDCSWPEFGDGILHFVVRAAEYGVDPDRSRISECRIEFHVQAIGFLRRLIFDVLEQAINGHGLQPL